MLLLKLSPPENIPGLFHLHSAASPLLLCTLSVCHIISGPSLIHRRSTVDGALRPHDLPAAPHQHNGHDYLSPRQSTSSRNIHKPSTVQQQVQHASAYRHTTLGRGSSQPRATSQRPNPPRQTALRSTPPRARQ